MYIQGKRQDPFTSSVVFDGTFLDGSVGTKRGVGEELMLNTDGSWSTVNPENSVLNRQGSYVVTSKAAGVPEPNILALFSVGLVKLGFSRRRRLPIRTQGPVSA